MVTGRIFCKRRNDKLRMKIVIVFLLITIEAQRSECSSKILRAAHGEVFSRNGGSYNILVPSGRKILLRIDQLDLKRNGFVKIRNHRTGDTLRYTKKGGNAYKLNGTTNTQVNLPIYTELDATKVRIWLKRGNNIRMQYTTFREDSSHCRKSSLNVNDVSCDSEELTPTATWCRVLHKCGTNYKKRSDRVTCVASRWSRDKLCKPKVEVVNDKCSFDFKNFTIDSKCPFTNEELARHLLNEETPPELAMPASPAGQDRASGKRVDCRLTCARRAGRWRLNCNAPTSKSFYVRCVVCRVLYDCGRTTVFFP